ncbi:MAG: hypothetical protein BWY74_00364 [Firmicutes bacterium ADurb.Bin419]|nr:MAG: hypothetical protein BWY74_00364 [Firmicutes bacterium ADurb.Bin419]
MLEISDIIICKNAFNTNKVVAMFNFFKFISSKLKSGIEEQKGNEPSREIGNEPLRETGKEILHRNPDVEGKNWNLDFKPLRSLVIWGFDENKNPSFLTLYGLQDFTQAHMLSDEVTYTSYAVFKGKGGHLPSAKAVEFVDRENMNHGLFYKCRRSYYYDWSKKDEFKVKEFYNLNTENYVNVPYFSPISHEELVRKVGLRLLPKGFIPVRSPDDILNLTGELAQYFDIVVKMITHQNIYIRKKLLTELISKDPPKELYYRILNWGSTELISGLFLELAKKSNPILKAEAEELVASEIDWAEDNFAKGVKRCANIYINSLDPDYRAKRTEWIRESLKNMDLHFTNIGGKEVPQGNIIDGVVYRKYANQGKFMDYINIYDNEKRKCVWSEVQTRYKVGPYSDGKKLKIIDFKSTIQEAEIYQLADVIGCIAYYLDAPRLTYYLRGSGKLKAHKYFQRYLRRIMDTYAQTNEAKFMEAMKHLLTGYGENDYVCKYPGNFQYNVFIKYYLYHEFGEKAPSDWSKHYQWVTNDQLVRLKGRYEFRKEIWDRNLEIVADIAANAKVDVVIKACYYILKDSPNAPKFINEIKYSQLIKLALSPYKPLSETFKNILKDRMEKLNSFDTDLMLALMDCSDEEMNKAAMVYFKKNGGLLSPSIIAQLLFMGNINQWADLFHENLMAFETSQYVEFIRQLLKPELCNSEWDRSLSTSVTDSLSASAGKIREASEADKVSIMREIIALLFHKKIPDWQAGFLEELIFSFTYENMETILTEVEISPAIRSTSVRNKCIISVLEAVKLKKLPKDSDVINILETGTSKMIKMLNEILTRNKLQMVDRLSTLLVMFEADVLALNRLAEEVFDSMQKEEQKRLHSLIIDSPVERAYLLGLKKLDLIYEDAIPEQFIIQMLEHDSNKVKTYISDKIDKAIAHCGVGNGELFMYYLKTLLLLPNKNSGSKEKVYKVLPQFVRLNKDKLSEIENILLDIGGSNKIIDSERALVTLAKIRKDGDLNAG